MSSTKMRSKVIVLTTDPVQITKLRNKLAEYERRENFPHKAPETDPHATYKYRLLKALLDDGVLDVEEKQALFAQYTWHQPAAFNDAAFIVESYNLGETAALSGGTGLR